VENTEGWGKKSSEKLKRCLKEQSGKSSHRGAVDLGPVKKKPISHKKKPNKSGGQRRKKKRKGKIVESRAHGLTNLGDTKRKREESLIKGSELQPGKERERGMEKIGGHKRRSAPPK